MSSPPINYTICPALSPIFLQNPSQLLSRSTDIKYLTASTIVTNPDGEILLLRRAAHDSWALRWEIPGGCVEADDDSFVAAAVRELWEETGLRATYVRSAVGLAPEEDVQDERKRQEKKEEMAEMSGDMCIFQVGSDVWGKFTGWINVESCDSVTIRVDEHEEWTWLSKDEARNEELRDGRKLDFVSDGVRRIVLDGFRLWMEEQDL